MHEFNALREEALGFTNITNPTIAKDYGINKSFTTIYRIDCSRLSLSDFIQFFESPAIPCIISGIPAAESWAATEKWGNSVNDISKHFRNIRERYFKVGEDDDGYSVKVSYHVNGMLVIA